MSMRTLQSTFTLGELSEKLFAKVDFEGYYKGARKVRNLLGTPQGGLTRRFGTRYVDTIGDRTNANAPVTNSDQVIATTFFYEKTNEKFKLVIRPDTTSTVAVDIYDEDDNLDASVGMTAYTAANIIDLNFVEAEDRIMVLHEDVQPYEIVFDGTNWSVNVVTFVNLPTYDFSLRDGASYRGPTDTFTPSATTGTGVTLTAANAVFTAGHVGGLFVGGGGVFRITAVNAGGTVATGDVFEDFNGTGAIKGINSLLEEAAWGDYSGGTPAGKVRGWPSVGVLFQNRLWLAHSSALGTVLWASNQGDFLNFDDSEGTDLNAFGYELSSPIEHIIGSKTLVVLTSASVEATSAYLDDAVTVNNVFIQRQAFTGSSEVGPVIFDNQILFDDSVSEQIKSIQYQISENSYVVTDATLLSPQLIDETQRMAQYTPNNDLGQILLSVNADGTLATLQSLIDQNIQAWTGQNTYGNFRDVASIREMAYFVVERSVNTGATVGGFADVFYSSESSFDFYTDITASVESASDDIELFSSNGDYLVIGHQTPFNRINFDLNTVASADLSLTFEYLDDMGNWEAFTPTDGTTGLTASGEVSWNLSTDTDTWAGQTFNSVERKFWIRIKRSNSNTITAPIENLIKINVATRLYVEEVVSPEFNDNAGFMDCEIIKSSDANGLVTGLGALEGQKVYARINKIPYGPYFVEGGEITVPVASATSVVVGVNFIPEMVPMPLAIPTQQGVSVYHPKHISSMFLDYYKTLGLQIGDYEIPSLQINIAVLDQEPEPVSSFIEYSPMGSWDPREQILITQKLPFPMTVIGIGYRVEVS